MPRFTPFTAVRYRDRTIDDLIAPPYDVLSDADLDRLGARSVFNITHVDVPRETDGSGRYDRAASTLNAWIDSGVMEPDEVATYTIYRMSFVDETGEARSIVGVLGGLEVVEPGSGGVLPHERVTPKASTDRLDLTRATRANMSPVWGLSLASGLTELLRQPGEHVASVVVDGVTHTVERVAAAERIAAIGACIAADDVLIADGHHRYGVAQTYRREQGDDGPDAAADTLAFVNELIADQLSVAAIHRLYSEVTIDELAAALDNFFIRSPAAVAPDALLSEMDRRGALCLVTADCERQWLDPRPGVFDEVRSIDGAWLEHALAELGPTVSYQHGVDHVIDALDSGRASAAVLIRPVDIVEIERTAREGLLMPPKSTFFTPKLLTGLVIRVMT